MDDDSLAGAQGRRGCLGWLLITGIGVAVAVAAGPQRMWWVAELLMSFLPQIGLACGGAAAVLVARRHAVAATIPGAVAIIAVLVLLPLWAARPAAPSEGGGPTISVMAHNVHGHGRESLTGVLDAIEAADADVVFLSQVPSAWWAPLSERSGSYQLLRFTPLDTPLLHLALVKVPARQVASLEMHDASTSSAVALEVPLGDERLCVLGVQTRSPRRPHLMRRRNDQLEAIGRYVLSQDAPVLVIGDLNTTPWSPALRRLESSGLHNSQRGFGLQPTWPAGLGPLMVPIDHALHSDELVVTERRTGPARGSEHRSVVVDLHLVADSP